MSKELEEIKSIVFANFGALGFYNPAMNNEILNDRDKVLNYLIKYQSLENENELLKEIIKSLFDRGCPLHQYIDKDFGLTIEISDDCSIMHLGEYKGVDLDKKLKEVLE